jgi:hypothetical protein
VVNSLLACGLDLYGVSATHVATDTLRAELQAAEQRKRTLTAELEALTGRRQATASLDVERHVAAELTRW